MGEVLKRNLVSVMKAAREDIERLEVLAYYREGPLQARIVERKMSPAYYNLDALIKELESEVLIVSAEPKRGPFYPTGDLYCATCKERTRHVAMDVGVICSKHQGYELI